MSGRTPEGWAAQLEETSVSEPADLFALAMAQARAEALEEAALIAERGDDIAERIRALAKPEGHKP